MVLIHAVENDPPATSTRQVEQERIDRAIADFLARGRQIESVAEPKLPSHSIIDDANLAKLLVGHASNAKTLAEAAKLLNEPESRCRRLAVEYRIPFRSKSFLKKRAAK
ncbi:hypothetical protein ACCD10_20490 [Pseudomonas sp. Pseusp122]|uniref:hypothetical protein n=1 Tax=unclassified Pseudomonas TaxID=196821 RepID=UPI0039A69736